MTHADIIARREALRRLVVGAVGTTTIPGWVTDLAASSLARADAQMHHPAPVAGAWRPKVLTAYQNEAVATIAELIIPQTDTAGARAARVNEFIDAVLADSEPDTRNKFLNGLSWIDQRCRSRYGSDFIKATPAQQAALLEPLNRPVENRKPAPGEKESAYVPAQPLQRDRAESPPDQLALDFFKSIKSMTITGYYTSAIGMKEELGDDGNVIFEDYLGCDEPTPTRRGGAGR